MRCPGCGSENPERARFCMECGAALTTPAAAPRPHAEPLTLDPRPSTLNPPPSTGEAERRQLTVMFCDLVGSTPLAERLDPEALREVMGAHRTACFEVIRHYDGHLAKYLGDGLLIYFGYPRAHEDDAHRAVRAGLEILAALPSLNACLAEAIPAMRGAPLQARIGIHTGLVVAGEIGEGDERERMAIVGDTPNIAARLQEMASPNALLISQASFRLVQGFFQCRNLGSQPLKGIAAPMPVYHVLGESETRSRLEASAGAGLTRLVGRETEVERLLARWEEVREGAGHAVLLSGEAGIGKSRLVRGLLEHLAGEPHTWVEWRGSPYHQNSALYPVIERWQRLLQFGRDDSAEEKLEKLEGALAPYPFPFPEAVLLLGSLLSVPLGERYRPLGLTPQAQKQKTLELLRDWLREMGARQPVALVVEDLHWVDPSTLELLGLLLDPEPPAGVLVLLTARPDFRSPWPDRPDRSQITLSRLVRDHAVAMVTAVTGGKTLPAEVLQQVVTRTDGIPLFVEELTRMVLESGLLQEQEGEYQLTGPLPPLAIPTTLQDSLMARLDRLASIKEVAQMGATLGREFSYEQLQAVSPLEESTLQRELARLVEAELLYQQGEPPGARYVFKHALIQEAAYQSLLRSTRQQYHQQIAQVLEERFPETVETQPEVVAHHYTEAGLTEPAIRYWEQAGQRATERSANLEAIAHLTRGLALLVSVPDTPERTRHEIILLLALGPPLMATKGWAAPEILSGYTRARALCEQTGDTPQLFLALWGVWNGHTVQGKLQIARKIGEQLLALAQRLGDPALLLQAHHALGPNLVYLGEWTSARPHLEQATALYDPQQHRSHAFLYGGHDPGVCCLHQGAWVLWMLGYPDQALTRSQEGLTLARELAHPASMAHAYAYSAICYQFRRGRQETQELAEAAVALSTQQGLPPYLALGSVLRGWALAEQGQGEEGIAQIRQGLVAHQASGNAIFSLYFLALLAETYGKGGQAEAGLAVLAEALAAANNGEERVYEPELYRLRGELLLALSAENHAEAEACFRQAVEAARRQGAKSLELRAVMSQCRLLGRQGQRAAAQHMLAEIYGWFTEGFETRDLQEAKALLDELS